MWNRNIVIFFPSQQIFPASPSSTFQRRWWHQSAPGYVVSVHHPTASASGLNSPWLSRYDGISEFGRQEKFWGKPPRAGHPRQWRKMERGHNKVINASLIHSISSLHSQNTKHISRKFPTHLNLKFTQFHHSISNTIQR